VIGKGREGMLIDRPAFANACPESPLIVNLAKGQVFGVFTRQVRFRPALMRISFRKIPPQQEADQSRSQSSARRAYDNPRLIRARSIIEASHDHRSGCAPDGISRPGETIEHREVQPVSEPAAWSIRLAASEQPKDTRHGSGD
jgi:hypothetical protein